ncbi:heterokaryon incompatibility protein-domain-containing protein [Diaporthe sp. PMI_573]|nr:heterokaryon incompatibility protein-domain-containing protein [Diaporthaceae sp. PMI_573]
MPPSSTDQRPGALRRLQSRLRVTRLQSSGGHTINRSTTKIVRPPVLRKDSQFRRSRRRPEEPFAYASLQNQPFIRLLKLEKRAVTDRRPLGHILTTVRLSEAPPFYALSYCWGSATRDKDIVCNGKLLSVTVHLKRGIQELQAIPMLAESWIWIDQISINQDDLDERSHQVGLMERIYVQAIRTIVWLGPSDGPCEGGYGLSEKLFELCQRQEYSSFNLGWKMRHPKRKLNEELDDSLRLAVPRLNSPPWAELDKMLKKPWFSRIWVIQEVDLSKETPLLVYGGKARDFTPLLLAGRWIGGSKILPISESPAPKPLTSFCLEDLYLILNSRHRWSLEALLLHTLDHEATDPRDHIFALLGIAAETSRTMSWPSELRPDYKSPPWRIFRQVTMYLIEQTGYLTPLLLVGSTSGVKDDAHPSWVPDYGAKPTMPCPTGVTLRASRTIRVTLPWRASGSLTTIIQQYQNDRKLSLDGFEVDQILWTSAGTTNERDDSILFRWLEGAAGAILWSFDSFHSSVDYDSVLTGFFDAFVRIVCSVYEDGTYRPRLADVLEYMDVQEAAENPREGYFRTMRTRMVGSLLRESAPPTKSCQVSQLLEYFTLRSWDIFLTKGGDLGIARRAGRLGDAVAVLRGGAMPFILRPVSTGVELLGACVVLKWMNGLAIDMWKQSKIEKSTFTLV